MKIKYYLITLTIFCTCLHAHEDPSDAIDTLTHKISETEDKKGLAELYYKRFIEAKAVDNRILALKDISKSVQLDPDNFNYKLSLYSYSEGPLAESALTDLIEQAEDGSQKCAAHKLKSEKLYSKKEYADADLHCDKAISHDKQNDLSLILFKSHLLWKLDKLDERVDFLTKAMGTNASAVLINTWIDAHIDAGKGALVKKIITKEMNESRFQSSWLIRLALCEAGPGAKVYAQQAVTEIKTRLNLDHPDVTLLMDLARAYSIQGEQQKAVFYAARAKKLAHDKWAMNELEAKIKR